MNWKKQLQLGTLVLSLMVATTASAVTPHQIDFGTEVSYIKYEEPSIMEEKGAMFGVFGAYTYRESNVPYVLKADAKFSYGQVDYESVNTGTVDNIDDFLVEVRMAVGKDYVVGGNSRVTPYFGFGYRYLNDQLGGHLSTTGHSGYDRESNYYYLPLGVDLQNTLSSDWTLEWNAEFDIFLTGRQKSHLEDVHPSLNTITNTQNSGYGVRGSVKLIKELENTTLFIEPFIRYWNIDDSNVAVITTAGTPIGGGLEPENTSFEAGGKIGFRF